jgi:hypothetical protein
LKNNNKKLFFNCKIKYYKIFSYSLFISLNLILSFFTISAPPINDNNVLNNIVLVSKSNGLETPEKEGGNTEYEIADINNDGHVDIISVGDHGSPYINSDQHGIMVWLGDENGNWTVHQDGDFGYGGCAIGDLDLDGYLDVVWGIHHDYGSNGYGDSLIGAALGNGTGSDWIPWANGLGTNGETYGMFATDLEDFNCDGLLDIVSQSFGCCNGLHLYENHGDGNWSPVWSLTGGNVEAILETGDINADGYPDFVSTRPGSIIFLGDGTFNFTINDSGLPTSDIDSIDCGDMNNDGRDDIVISYSSSGVYCYVYDEGNDTWISYSNGLPTTGQYPLTQFGDIDGNGTLDIVAYEEPTGYVYLGDGNGNWINDGSFTMPSPGGSSAMRVDGDIDHDGREDIIIQADAGTWPSYQNQLKLFSPWEEPINLSGQIKKPNGGETYKIGSIREISWLAAIPPSHGQADVEIKLSENGINGPWTTIASNLSNNGKYQWYINAYDSTNCRIKIIITTNQSSVEVISSSDFILTQGNANDAPNIPTRPNGPSTGEAFINYNFTTLSTDINNDNIKYGWDWNGDLIIDEWTNYYTSGNSIQTQHQWTLSGIYDIRVIAEDGNGAQSVFSDPWTIIIDQPDSTIPLLIGWNMITIPFENNLSASNLAENITGCLSVSKWDAINQTYNTFIVGGPPSFDFSIGNGSGYFVDVTHSSLFSLSETPISIVNISLKIGWNLIGWFHDYDTSSSGLASNISGSLSVSKWDAINQTYHTYIVGGPQSFDFTIKSGIGLFVDVSIESTWRGEG